MLFRIFFLIHTVASISNQADLSITGYSHIGCLTLKPDKQFIFDGIQNSALSPYQSFASSNMTVDFCFRLCRRWIILMNPNQTTCICLYTVNEVYEVNEYLGEVLSLDNCSPNTVQIYSLTKDPYLLPSPTPTDDWSLDGCYHLRGIQIYHANLLLNGTNYTQAMDACRKLCQSVRSPTYFSFFLSMKKFCYCLPIKISPSITTDAVRKPLVHCSFLPYIGKSLNNSFNYSEINSDTVVKINVQRYCSSSFIFDRTLYLCLRIVLLDAINSYSRITPSETCSPVLIKTVEQWRHFASFSPLLRSRTFIWIDRDSTYIVEDLFKSKIASLPRGNLCLVFDRTGSPTHNLISCSAVQSPGYIFCSQKPMEPINFNQSEFQSMYVSVRLSYYIFLSLDNPFLSPIISLARKTLFSSITCVIMWTHPLFTAFNMANNFVPIDIEIVPSSNFSLINGVMSIPHDFSVEHRMMSYWNYSIIN